MSLPALITVSHRPWLMIAVYLSERRLLSFVMSITLRNRNLLRQCGVVSVTDSLTRLSPLVRAVGNLRCCLFEPFIHSTRCTSVVFCLWDIHNETVILFVVYSWYSRTWMSTVGLLTSVFLATRRNAVLYSYRRRD